MAEPEQRQTLFGKLYTVYNRAFRFITRLQLRNNLRLFGRFLAYFIALCVILKNTSKNALAPEFKYYFIGALVNSFVLKFLAKNAQNRPLDIVVLVNQYHRQINMTQPPVNHSSQPENTLALISYCYTSIASLLSTHPAEPPPPPPSQSQSPRIELIGDDSATLSSVPVTERNGLWHFLENIYYTIAACITPSHELSAESIRMRVTLIRILDQLVAFIERIQRLSPYEREVFFLNFSRRQNFGFNSEYMPYVDYLSPAQLQRILSDTQAIPQASETVNARLDTPSAPQPLETMNARSLGDRISRLITRTLIDNLQVRVMPYILASHVPERNLIAQGHTETPFLSLNRLIAEQISTEIMANGAIRARMNVSGMELVVLALNPAHSSNDAIDNKVWPVIEKLHALQNALGNAPYYNRTRVLIFYAIDSLCYYRDRNYTYEIERLRELLIAFRRIIFILHESRQPALAITKKLIIKLALNRLATAAEVIEIPDDQQTRLLEIYQQLKELYRHNCQRVFADIKTSLVASISQACHFLTGDLASYAAQLQTFMDNNFDPTTELDEELGILKRIILDAKVICPHNSGRQRFIEKHRTAFNKLLAPLIQQEIDTLRTRANQASTTPEQEEEEIKTIAARMREEQHRLRTDAGYRQEWSEAYAQTMQPR